jgi:hypothetical protein
MTTDCQKRRSTRLTFSLVGILGGFGEHSARFPIPIDDGGPGFSKGPLVLRCEQSASLASR